MPKKSPIDRNAGRITIRIGELKAKWVQRCRLANVSPAEPLRAFIAKAINEPGATPNQSIDWGDNLPPHYLKVKISQSLREVSRERAQLEGFPSINRYVSALLASHISGSPQLNYPEYEALIESNRQLLAIGRNLNQLVIDVKTANAKNADLSTIGNFRFGVLEQLREQINRHTTLVRQVLAANITRWNA